MTIKRHIMAWLKTGYTTRLNIEPCHQKNQLRLKRKHRGGNYKGRSKGNDRRSNGKRIREDKRKKDKKTIKSLTRTISALSCKADDSEYSSDEASVASEASEPPSKSNRTHSSLTHQKGSRK
jgi:hypothetical protein